MGCVCCCLRFDDYEDYTNPNSSVYRNCPCLRCFIQNCLNAYSTVFRRGEVHALPSSVEGASALTTTAGDEDNLSDMYNSPPRPLPYDADPRCFHLQRGGLVSRRDKGSSHLHEESEPLRLNDGNAVLDPLSAGEKCYGSDEGGSTDFCDPPLKHPSAKLASGFGYIYSSSEEEDVCPTCLEEYTPENPKIMTRCAHHYHLGCIYEWMERSDSCPVCGKVMEFDESI